MNEVRIRLVAQGGEVDETIEVKLDEYIYHSWVMLALALGKL